MHDQDVLLLPQGGTPYCSASPSVATSCKRRADICDLPGTSNWAKPHRRFEFSHCCRLIRLIDRLTLHNRPTLCQSEPGPTMPDYDKEKGAHASHAAVLQMQRDASLSLMPLFRAARAVDFLQNYTAPSDRNETYIRKLVRCKPDLKVALHPSRSKALICCLASLQQDIANRQSRTLEISLDDVEEVCPAAACHLAPSRWQHICSPRAAAPLGSAAGPGVDCCRAVHGHHER